MRGAGEYSPVKFFIDENQSKAKRPGTKEGGFKEGGIFLLFIIRKYFYPELKFQFGELGPFSQISCY